MRLGKTVSFIGAGNMAEALIKGILKAGLFDPADITVADTTADRLECLKRSYGVSTVADNGEAASCSEIVVLSVKPQVLPHVLPEIVGHTSHNPLVISVVAGTHLASIASILGRHTRLVRVMPNTPAVVLGGAAALAMGTGASPQDMGTALRIFESVGLAVVVDEKLMDAVTGLSGSGPAYIFTMIEAMADGGVKMGLPREIALKLAAQTTLGAARMVLETGAHPAVLRETVTSPGGTTAYGLHHLEQAGIRAAMMGAVEAATMRSDELGRKGSEQ